MAILYQNKRTVTLDCSKDVTHSLGDYPIVMWDKFLDLEMVVLIK
jgi:hypothetical protein